MTLANRGRALLLGILALPMTVAARGEADTEVPARLLEAARLPPVAFAMSLANSLVPVGIEFRGSSLASPGAMPLFDVERQPTVSVTRVLEAFNASHGDYRAVLLDSVVVVRPIDRRVRYLDAPAPFDALTIMDPMRAVRRIFLPLDSHLEGSGGRINDTTVEQGKYITVTLFGTGQSVVGVLNQLSVQSERGWIVYTSIDDTGVARADWAGLIQRRSLLGVVVNH